MLKLRAKISNLRVHLQHFHRIRFKYQAARSLVANHSCWPSLRMFYPRFCSSCVTLKPLVANDSYMQQEGTELCASLLACALLSSCSLSHGLLVKPRPVGTPHTQCPHQMLHAYLLPLSYSRQFSVLWVTAVPSGAQAVEEQHSGVLAQHNHIQSYYEQKYRSCALFGAGAVTWALSHSPVLRETSASLVVTLGESSAWLISCDCAWRGRLHEETFTIISCAFLRKRIHLCNLLS